MLKKYRETLRRQTAREMEGGKTIGQRLQQDHEKCSSMSYHPERTRASRPCSQLSRALVFEKEAQQSVEDRRSRTEKGASSRRRVKSTRTT